MIPDSFIQELLDRVDIVDVVQRYVPLKKAGANYSACCPFHSEKSPSFTVSPTKQFYHCFGCGAHGSAIGFIMAHQGLGFIDAVEELAGNLGLTVPNEGRQQNPQFAEKKASLTETTARAARYFKDQLKASPRAIDYLKGRGLTGEIAARFGLGYAPDEWQGLETVFSDYKAAELATVGLVIDNEQGRRYDRFRDRIMFPILDARSNVIGFGGRIIKPEDTPKYMNSPETPLFDKGRELYGLTQARQFIRDTDTVIVVEGYMDVVALAQHGVGNAVATLGTATTGDHIHKLMRQAEKIVFCFDGDKAGRKAAWRALENSLPHLADDHSLGFLFLPPEHDPDSYVREHGAETFQRLVAQPTSLIEFFIRELSNRIESNGDDSGRLLITEAEPLITQIGPGAPLLRLQLLKELAAKSGFSQAELEGQYKIKPMAAPSRRPPPAPRSRPSARPLDHTLLEIILQQPTWATRLPLELIPNNTQEGAVLHAIADALEHGDLPAGGIGLLLEHFRNSPHEEVIARFASQMAEDLDVSELEQVLNDSVEHIRNAGVGQEIAVLTERARNGGLSPEERQRLTALLQRKSSYKPAASS
ncbi:MAG TPA: DNA primase [Rhodocyclaceae bacterium]|nr:DNA primase [Rhodocyclaceae bacterium]